MRILVIFGTRPEALKLAPLIQTLQCADGVELRTCATGQHRQMLEQVLQLFDLQPDFSLDIMRPGQTLGDVTAAICQKLGQVMQTWRPDWVVVQGDTTTSFAAALTAFYHRVPVAHVEAGLRTGDPQSPWPEEINRRLTTVLTDLHFAPTRWAMDHLLREGVAASRIWVTGNTIVDALMQIVRRLHTDVGLAAGLAEQFPFLNPERRLVLVTAHRRESFGAGLEQICQAVADLCRRGDVQVVYPVHLNPQVREPVGRLLGGCPNFHAIEPLEYVPFVYLMERAYLILTDSGGIQEEAPSLGKPVLVMRDTTERPEGVTAGTVRLVGTERRRIVAEATRLLEDAAAYAQMAQVRNPYGDGQASARIAHELVNWNPASRWQRQAA